MLKYVYICIDPCIDFIHIQRSPSSSQLFPVFFVIHTAICLLQGQGDQDLGKSTGWMGKEIRIGTVPQTAQNTLLLFKKQVNGPSSL